MPHFILFDTGWGKTFGDVKAKTSRWRTQSTSSCFLPQTPVVRFTVSLVIVVSIRSHFHSRIFTRISLAQISCVISVSGYLSTAGTTFRKKHASNSRRHRRRFDDDVRFATRRVHNGLLLIYLRAFLTLFFFLSSFVLLPSILTLGGT